MKSKDLKIICELRKNARSSLTNISKKTKIPVSTLFDKIKSNEYIDKFTTLVNYTKIGYLSKANIFIKVDKSDKNNLKDYFRREPRINSAYRINNGFDFLIEVIAKDIAQLEEFIDRIEEKFKILEVRTCMVIEDIKREEFLEDLSVLAESKTI